MIVGCTDELAKIAVDTIIEEWKKNKSKWLDIDISSIIKREFYLFIREFPNYYKNADWKDPFSECRFDLPANRAAEKIMEFLKR